MVTILASIVHIFTSPCSLGKWTEEIEKPVLPPYAEEEGVLLPFGKKMLQSPGECEVVASW